MNQVVSELYEPLYWYVKKRINSTEDAEDITQEVFLRLAKTDMGKLESVKSWLYRVAQNAITDHYRRKKIPVSGVEVEVPDEPSDESSSDKQLSSCVESFVHQLPEEDRKLIEMSELKGIRQKQIAEDLGMNYTTVRSKIQRGREKLKDLVEDCCTVIQGHQGSIIDHICKKGC